MEKVVLGIILVGIIILLISRPSKEGFKVLGTLAPYSDLYYRCYSECERSDPAKRLYPTKGSFMCGEYCDSTITRMARIGGPSDPKEPKLPSPPVKSVINDSYKICGDGVKGDWCRALYHSASEIYEKCRQDCQYSTQTGTQCMDLCSRSLDANKSISGGWSWK
jgi:hypothetical protein